MLIDGFGRPITYLRLAITDRCNLRCSYCMPEKGLDWLPRRDLLSYEEMLRLCGVFATLGITKIRFTGGEPTLRKGFNAFVEEIHQRRWFTSMHLTSNATRAIQTHNAKGERIWDSINISLDSLNPANFYQITKRDEWSLVMENIEAVVSSGIPLRVNMVVMDEHNAHEIVDFAQWAFRQPIDIRFIEEMPFNGSGLQQPIVWTNSKIEEHIRVHIPLEKIGRPSSGETATYYTAAGMIGRIGIIAAYTRSFCGSCNRIRLTPQGELLTCLYSDRGISLRDILRNGASDLELEEAIRNAVRSKERDGHQAEKQRITTIAESMARIGG
jgi:molybdenum cofactor biosynthesis protein A